MWMDDFLHSVERMATAAETIAGQFIRYNDARENEASEPSLRGKKLGRGEEEK